MSVQRIWRAALACAARFARAKRGNVAMIYALSLIPITVAAGAGLDMGRAMVVRARLAEALDAAGLAVGATSGLSNAQMQTLAQQYFNANYTADTSFGTPASVSLSQGENHVTVMPGLQPIPGLLASAVEFNGTTTINTGAS